MQITTSTVIDANLKRFRVCHQHILGDITFGSIPTEDALAHYALEALEDSSRVVSYFYRDLRGKSQLSARYCDVDVLVHSSAGRTLITFQKVDSDPEVSATFIGASDGVCVNIQSAYSPDNQSLYDLLEVVKQFAEVCTLEMFAEDRAVGIGV